MNSFIQYVLYELGNSIVLIIPAGILATIAIIVSYCLFKKKHKHEKKFPFGRIFMYLLFVGYISIVFYATFLRGHGGYSQRELNLHLFRAWREAWNNFSVKNWANVLLNVAMFVPLGALLPLIWKKCKKWYITTPIGFGSSLLIELVQLTISRGICDVDDLFANTLGTVLGFLCMMAVLSLFNEKGHKLKPCLLYCGIALIPILSICSIFISYNIQEYGNLANAPAYKVNTKDVSWTLDCQLPSSEAAVAVYRTQTRSTAQCDAFAKEMAENAGLTVDMTSYYQEYAYYNFLPRGILLVNYYDGSYEFRSGAYRHDTKWIESDRQTIEKALEVYPVNIPARAEFSYEGDGWHNFTAHRHIDGALMYDGTLRARYTEDGKVEQIENLLSTYSYYEDVDVISAEEAYAQLKAGHFYDGGYFEYAAPQTVSVTDCEFDYQVDTKGYYQPVYIFYMEATDVSYGYNVIIPAMK